MSLKIYEMLAKEVSRREDPEWLSEANLMADLYHGKLPEEYMKFFPKKSPVHIVQVIRNAWDDLASSVGRMPNFRVDPLDETVAEDKRAGLAEKIAFKYLHDSEPSGRLLMRMNGWWLVGTGRSVMMVRPDHKQGKPILTYRDPRNCYPNMRTVGGVPVEIYDLIFKYDIPRLTAHEMGLAGPVDEPGKPGPYTTQKDTVTIIELVDDQSYTIVSEEGRMFRDDHKLGMVPGWVQQNFAPNSDSGVSLFKDQVSLMVAISMLVTLKLAAADKTVNPIYWARGHQGTIKIGPNTLTKLSSGGEIGVLPPPVLRQVDQDIAQLVNFSNILNKNPEVRQGQVDSKGAYVSSKTLDTLDNALDTTLGDYWDINAVGLKHLMGVMFRMDEMLWPNDEKRISLNIRGKSERDVYTPKDDIDGKYDIIPEYGFGQGGYQGFLQNMQANAAKMLSRETAMEAMPGGNHDSDREIRQMKLEDMDDALMASLQAQSVDGRLDLMMGAALRKRVAEGEDLYEALLKLQQEAQEQAQQVQEQGAEGVAPITTPGPDQPPGAQEGVDLRALPGLAPGGITP